ncbi:pilus assembly protein PilM [Candidatus Uhrbacteria bacterium]|nr:pilus assembly protein PilM [Candidatus Uhrbacteria bacterium]
MSFFKSKPSSFVGVDIGASGIKVAELTREKGRSRLMTYGYTERRASDPVVSPLDNPAGTGAQLARLLKEADVRSKHAMTALPSSSVFSAIVTVPKRPTEKELRPYVDAEAAKLSPIPLADMVTYAKAIDPLGGAGGGRRSGGAGSGSAGEAGGKVVGDPLALLKGEARKPGYVRVLVTGAARTMVDAYVQIFAAAGLQLEAIDTESFAVIRSLVGLDRSAVCLVDFGFNRTTITLSEKQLPMMVRTINIGGQAVTRRIMEQMKVDEDRAEQMKRDLSLSGEEVAMPPFLESVYQPLVHEIRYSLSLYSNMEAADVKTVDKIILTGGSSVLPFAVEYMTKALNINVYLGDPWARVAYPADLRSSLDEIGPRLSVAVGLAMREPEEKK